MHDMKMLWCRMFGNYHNRTQKQESWKNIEYNSKSQLTNLTNRNNELTHEREKLNAMNDELDVQMVHKQCA